MKVRNLTIRGLSFVTGALFLCGVCPEAWAAEGGDDWRPIYDYVMLWVNFGILAFVIIKFGKGPIMKFLQGQRDEVAREIEELETGKAHVAGQISEVRQKLEDSDAQFSELQERFVRQGEKRKQQIIDEAQEQSELMMEMAKQRIQNQINDAKMAFKEELVDLAIDLAQERLPGEITEQDSDKFVAMYMSNISAK